MWPALSSVLRFKSLLILSSLLISFYIDAASLPSNDYESLLEAPVVENKPTERREIFLEELDTSRRIQRPFDLSLNGEDKEMKELVKQDMALQIRPSNMLTLEDEADGDSLLRH
ncbi:hypothetical protein M3Y97_00381000 [Aphelenchoides bicaudatus]|nr:hypothetical protein M3Y97_00381000 [Aphelenchoides bicaudatus]